jgi:endonuclease/exonuclease/phosphatase family metal-dependent hydrolase
MEMLRRSGSKDIFRRQTSRDSSGATPRPATGKHPSSLVSVVQNSKGRPIRIQSLTLHSSMRWLLLEMCRHSMGNADADQAIRDFAGVSEVPRDAEARTDVIFPRVLQAVELWLTEAAVTARHAKFCRKVKEVMPHVVTAVEYDSQWRILPLPTERYRFARGVGTAAVFFDSERFEQLEEFQGDPVRPGVDVIEVESWAQPGKSKTVAPKSSCVALLRQRVDSALFVVIAVHLESAPPSDTYSTRLRAAQLRALLRHLSSLVQQLKAAGYSCTIVVGGDFNTLLEEFVYGTEEEFWQSESVRAVQPPLLRPQEGMVPAPDPPVARLDAAGRVRLLCEVADGGELRQASYHEGMHCTRAGSSMVVDFIFAGSAGGDTAKGPATFALEVSTPHKMDMAARADSGVFHSVSDLGSDHLPVACELA